MALAGALVDRARTVRKEAAATRVQGRTQLVPTSSEWFKARLFLPPGQEALDAQAGRRRQIKKPTLLVGKKDLNGVVIAIKAEEKIEVDSRELGNAIWKVIGDPEPLRRRRSILGWQVTLERTKEPTRDDL